MENYRPETKCVFSGYRPKNGEPRQLPIIHSTTFKYDSSEAMGKLFDLEADGYFYTRMQNPTNDHVAAKICDLEGGVAAMLTSSGQAASFYSIFNIASAGDHIVCSSAIYGGTFNLFNVTMRKLGFEFTFVKPNTKAVFGETVSNPSLEVLDIERFAKAAHAHGVPLIVDNTFPTPINCRPFEFGADIVTHSTTKYMDGHGSGVGGCIVDSGNFDWTQNDKYPGLTTPDDSYHGITYTERFGKSAYIVKATAQLMRDLGSIPAPFNAFMLNFGLETLALRMERHCQNGLAVAKYMKDSEYIESITFPALEGDKSYDLVQKYMPKGTCGVVTFRIKGGREAATKFMDSLKLAQIATHVADARTCCLHPASTTHRQLTSQELADCGVYDNLIRLSVGIENIDDILEDVEQALIASQK